MVFGIYLHHFTHTFFDEDITLSAGRKNNEGVIHKNKRLLSYPVQEIIIGTDNQVEVKQAMFIIHFPAHEHGGVPGSAKPLVQFIFFKRISSYHPCPAFILQVLAMKPLDSGIVFKCMGHFFKDAVVIIIIPGVLEMDNISRGPQYSLVPGVADSLVPLRDPCSVRPVRNGRKIVFNISLNGTVYNDMLKRL